MRYFSFCHPVVLLGYYIVTISLLYLYFNPFVISLSCLLSVVFFATLHPFRITLKECSFYVAVFIFIFLMYILTVHNGATPLLFVNDHPLTFEAIMYALNLAGACVAICFWSKSYLAFITTNETLYLIAKLSKTVSIYIAIGLQFAPLLKRNVREARDVQKAIGYFRTKSKAEKLIRLIRLWLNVFYKTAEQLLDRTDSMQLRGYGVAKRTHFHLFQWRRRDYGVLVFTMIVLLYLMIKYQSFHYYFYPYLAELSVTKSDFILLLTWLSIPVLFELKGHLQWKYTRLKM